MDDVLRTVARDFWVSRHRIKRGERKTAVCLARDELCRRLYDQDGHSYPEIGKFLRLHHTSILMAVRRARGRLKQAD